MRWGPSHFTDVEIKPLGHGFKSQRSDVVTDPLAA